MRPDGQQEQMLPQALSTGYEECEHVLETLATDASQTPDFVSS